MKRALPVVLVALAACGGEDYRVLQPANLALSAEDLEFDAIPRGSSSTRQVILSNTGDVALGITSIALASETDPTRGNAGSFTLHFDPEAVIGGDGVPVDTDGGSAARWDTAPPEDTDDTDVVVDTDASDTDSTDDGVVYLVVLPPDSHLVVDVEFSPLYPSENFDGLVVTTANDDDPADGEPNVPKEDRVYRDPDQATRMIVLHGTETSPDARVTPKTVDAGTVWPGESATEYLTIANVGLAPLTVTSVVQNTDCSAGFLIVDAPDPAVPIAPGGASLVEIRFAPLVADEARCTIDITTDDPDVPEQSAKLVANRPSNPDNQAPSVSIDYPGVGYVHQGLGPIRMTITVTDPDQPASTLVCKVKSSLQLSGALATCLPPDGSGHTTVEIPISGYLQPGIDVLTLTATDRSGATRSASIPIMLNAPLAPTDEDGDAFAPDDLDHPDCNDADPEVYPLAAETWDGKDNDCDRRVDEGTDGADDDADGQSEVDGDCNDGHNDVYVGAPEKQDGVDNDCDGIIDESTSAYDDDGDGFTELELDCDDTDPDRNPSAPEVCDNHLDDNCNGLRDQQEVCVPSIGVPMIVGGIQLARTAVTAGGTVDFSVLVYESDGDELTHEWTIEDGAGHIDNPHAQRVTWTAPTRDQLPIDDIGAVYRVGYLGTDEQGNQAWAFADIEVYKKADVAAPLLVSVPGGCASSGSAPLGVLAIGLAALLIRRR
jgi:hypothetical protein